MATVWSFPWWLSGLQCIRWRSGQVDDRGKVNGIGPLSLLLCLALPSAEPGSSFDWISCELMRQAWRKASVVEVSYHILICSLSDACACVILDFSLTELNTRFSCIFNSKLALQCNCETKQSLTGRCVSRCPRTLNTELVCFICSAGGKCIHLQALNFWTITAFFLLLLAGTVTLNQPGKTVVSLMTKTAVLPSRMSSLKTGELLPALFSQV